MRIIQLNFCLLLLLLLMVGCSENQPVDGWVNAIDHGVTPENTGEENSQALQALIDELSVKGGTIYLPAGQYEFAENGRQTIGSHCITMRSDVSIIGDGDATVLKPVGNSQYGLDMFYFNDYLDTGEAIYLENCRFEKFVIDASATSCEIYTSAGKGFMMNLIRNCHWKNVTVKHTDATGFGVDCPINCTFSACVAIGCGKAATEENGGASGFGIGFGFSEDESISILECKAYDNRKFGFFLEHQGRFNEDMYGAKPNGSFAVSACFASGNLFGFGGICSMNTVYENCVSENSRRYGFYFENARDSRVLSCRSQNEGEASFAVVQNDTDGVREVSDISFLRCTGKNSPIGVMLMQEASAAPMLNNRVESCQFYGVRYTVYTEGQMQSLALIGNASDTTQNGFLADIADFQNSGNSWN